MRDNCRFCFIAGGKLVATFWDINEERPWEYLVIGVQQSLLAYQEETIKKDKLKASYKALMDFIDNQEFAYVMYEFRIYVDQNKYEVWETKRIEDGAGLNYWVAGKKIDEKEIIRTKEIKLAGNAGAVYVKHYEKPDVVVVAWGNKQYEYYLDGKNLQKYLFMRRKAGDNKAGIWLKKVAYKFEEIK